MRRFSRWFVLLVLFIFLGGCSFWKKDSETTDPFAEAPDAGFVEQKAASADTGGAYSSAGIDSRSSNANTVDRAVTPSQPRPLTGAIPEEAFQPSGPTDLNSLLPPGSSSNQDAMAFPEEPLAVSAGGGTPIVGGSIVGGPVEGDAPVETDSSQSDLGKMSFDDPVAGPTSLDPLDPSSSLTTGSSSPTDFDRTYRGAGPMGGPSPGPLSLNATLPQPTFRNPNLPALKENRNADLASAGAATRSQSGSPFGQNQVAAGGAASAVESFPSPSEPGPSQSLNPILPPVSASGPATVAGRDPIAPDSNVPARNEFSGPSSLPVTPPLPQRAPNPQSDPLIPEDPFLVAVDSNRPAPPRTDVSPRSSNPPVPAPRVEPAAPNTPAPEPAQLERRGIEQYQSRQFDQAVGTFREFLSLKYPDPKQEIQWRLAQSLYESNRYDEAAVEFRKLVGSPNPENRADALLKLGMIDEKKGETEAARTRWNRVVETYPNSKAAATARTRLASTAP